MKYLLFFIIITMASCNGAGSSGPVNNATTNNNNNLIANGENLFNANCANCHKPNQDYVGPALKGVSTRWESKTLLYEYIRNSADVISRNAYAKQLFIKYNQSPMLPFPNLTDADIDAILLYCETFQ